MSCASAAERPGGDDGAVVAELSLQRAAAMEELTLFRRWSIFLPRAYCVESEKNRTYVRSRHIGNPKFFEETRERLGGILRDLQVLNASGVDFMEEEALEAVLQAQWTALGFLADRQFHKALTLGEFCREVVDAAAARGTGGLAFWRLLVRVNLGDAYARFRRNEEALAIMKQALELIEQYSGQGAAAHDVGVGVGVGDSTHQAKDTLKTAFGSRERVLAGAIYSHLSRIHLEAGDNEEALRLTDLMVEVFERYIWDLGDTQEDREAQASVLATAYSHRGVCDVRRGKHENALAWLQRAQECVEKNADLSGDSAPILKGIKEQIVQAKHLHV